MISILILQLLQTALIQGGPIDDCCTKKDVGGVSYIHVGEQDTSKYNCPSNCIYEREDAPGSRFCFKSGNLPVTCLNSYGILVSGGYFQDNNGNYTNLDSTEFFIPSLNQSDTCPYRELPAPRQAHCMKTLGNNSPLICGGGNEAAQISCVQLNPTSPFGSWTPLNISLTEPRYASSCWVPEEGLEMVVMGGIFSGNTTETVPAGTSPFNLIEDTQYACPINTNSYTILTGGWFTLKNVTMYNIMGFVEFLPELSGEGRMAHGCGCYNSAEGEVLIVAGGAIPIPVNPDPGHYSKLEYLDTAEILKPGASSWTAIQPLPRKISSMASSVLNNILYILGGKDENMTRSEILSYQPVSDTWQPVGQLYKSRGSAAASNIQGSC